jgi:hypothetical protein
MDSYRFFRRHLGQVWRRRLTGRYVSVGRPVGRSVTVGQTFNEEAGGRRGEAGGWGRAGARRGGAGEGDGGAGGEGGGLKSGCISGECVCRLGHRNRCF